MGRKRQVLSDQQLQVLRRVKQMQVQILDKIVHQKIAKQEKTAAMGKIKR